MNVTIDIILCLLGISIVVLHTVRGFVKSVLGAVKLALAFILTFIITPAFFSTDDIGATLIAYLLVFASVFIVLTVVTFFLNKLFELPVLKTANKILGFILGLAVAYVVLCFASAILNVLLSYAGEQLFGQTNREILDSTLIYKFFNNVNIFPMIGK